MFDINTVNLAKSLIPFVGWFPDTQINNTSIQQYLRYKYSQYYRTVIGNLFIYKLIFQDKENLARTTQRKK